jgi:hypothetical protein
MTLVLRDPKFKNGIYKSENAIYFIYCDQIMMRINGGMYKTNENFMQGKWVDDLKPEMIEQFKEVYNKLKSW